MVFDFITERDGYLSLTDDEYSKALEKFPGIKYGCEIIEYGKNKDGYWTSEKFLEQIKRCTHYVSIHVIKLFGSLITQVVMDCR